MAIADLLILCGALRGSAGRRRREVGHPGRLMVAALSSVVISAFIVYTVAVEAAKFVTTIDLGYLMATGGSPPRPIRHRDALLGTLMVTLIAMARGHPDRPRQRDLPVRVRDPGTALGQTDPRDPSRHPQRRARLLRPHGHQPRRRPALFAEAPRVHRWRQAWRSASCPSRSSPRWPKMCARCPARSARPRTASARGAHHEHRRLPGGDLRHRGRLILAASRGIGETMVVALAAGATGGGVRSIDPLAPGQTMTAAMAALALGSDRGRRVECLPEPVLRRRSCSSSR